MDQSAVAETPVAGVNGKNVSFAERLDRLADVAVNVGLGLARGQELFMTAPLDALPLVRRITEHAYRAGAKLVTTLFADEPSALARFRFASDDSFDYAPQWLYDGIAEAFRSGAARLAVAGADPVLLAKEDPEKVSRANVALSKVYRPALELITGHEINWTIVPCATPAWARAVFPNASEGSAVEQLWNAVFAATRVDAPDPVGAWRKHSHDLQSRVEFLNKRRLAFLRFRGPGTDLRVGLAEGHVWQGGGSTAKNGIFGFPNMPTEEVFTTPHKDRTEGIVTSTKPLSHQGSLIENIQMRFEGGRITKASASKGETVLQRLIETDEGARRLGEVALVPHSSPIAASGLLFWNTLFDENAASHIALGQAYSNCIQNGDHLTPEQLTDRGANSSLIHVDWMIGSAKMDVDGIAADGTVGPLMRQGEWIE